MGKRKVTIITYDCPGCGASVKIDPEQTSATCEYCGMHFNIESEKVPPPNVEYTRNTQGTNYQRIDQQKARKYIILTLVIVCGFMFLPMFLGIIFSAVTLVNDFNTEISEATRVVEADPFEKVNVRIEGKEPWASVASVKSGTDLYGVKYSMNKSSGLSNGDVITIKAEPIVGYTWTVPTYEYTVSGLDTVLTDAAQLSEENQEILIQAAKLEIEKNWGINLENTNITPEDLQLDIRFYKIYINVNKNGEEHFFSSDNIVIPAFETTYEHEGKKYTVYQYAEVENVYLSTDGALHGDFNTITASGGYIHGDDFAVWGFETVLKMESAMENENFNLKK